MKLNMESPEFKTLGITQEDVDTKLQPFIYNVQNNVTEILNATGLMIDTGWGYKQGVAAQNMSNTVNFSVVFKELPYTVLVSPLGVSDNTPTLISDFILTGNNEAVVANDITRSGFNISLITVDAANFDANDYYGYSWLAIGKKA